MINIQLDKTALADVLKRLSRISSQKTKERVLRGASAVAYSNIIQHFSNQSGPDGRWAPWSASYSARMARKKKSKNRLLQETGHLRQTIKPGFDGKSGFVLADASYAAVHNFGSKSKNIPQREFMYLDDSTIEKIEDYVLNQILEVAS